MTIKPRQNLVAQSKHNIKCPHDMTAEFITVHNTANDASAANEINYMITNNNQVSYHFAVDDKEVVQGLPINRNGWHCGDGVSGNGNRKSIGVEICYSKSGGERYKKAETLTIKFIAQLLFERKWGVNKIKKHQDWSNKNCPHRILSEGRWTSFVNAIKSELDGLSTPLAQTLTSTASTHTVVAGETLSAIAARYKTTVQAIADLNKIVNADVIRVGQKLQIPGTTSAAQKPTATELKVGTKVKIKSTAKTYATGQTIPNWVKGKTYTVGQINSDRVLLSEIVSWVRKIDIE